MRPEAADSTADEQISTAEQELLLAEQYAALHEAVAHLPPCCRQLIALLIENPPVPNVEISARLGIPIERSGPTAAAALTSCAITRQSRR